MKKRKLLVLTLVLVLIAGSFPMTVSAADSNTTVLSDIAGLPGQEEIEVCQNLGIITGNPDGTFLPAKDVNRAEFAAIITRAMGIPDNALSAISTNFLDTAGYAWAVPYLAFCQSKGIMLGDGLGNAMPGRTITVDEAMTMICRAIGYVDNSRALVGAWPANYITLVRQLSLNNKLDSNVSNMTKEMSAIAIYNALTVQSVYVDTTGVTNPVWKVNPSAGNDGVPACLLNTGLGCDSESGAVLGDKWSFGNSLTNISDKIGAYGTAFYTKNDDLIAFKMDDGCALLTGTFSKSDFIGDDGRTYRFDQTASELTKSVDGMYFDNGSLVSARGSYSTAADLVSAFADRFDGKEVTVSAKISGSTIRTVYALSGWAASATDMVTDSWLQSVTDYDEFLGFDFPQNMNRKIDERQFGLIGAGSLDELSADVKAVVYVYADSDNVVRKIAFGGDQARGMISGTGNDYFMIGSKKYEYASEYLAIGDGIRKSDVADQISSDAVVYLDAYGYAYDVDTSGAGAGGFGVSVAFEGADVRNDACIKYINTNEKEELTYFAKAANVRWDGQTLSGESALTSRLSSLGANQLFGFSLNGSDRITEIFSPVDCSITLKGRTIASIDEGRGYKDYTLDRNAAVFTFERIGGKTVFGASDVGNISLVDAKQMSGCQAVFNSNKDKVTAILIPANAANPNSGVSFGVINDITQRSTSDRDVYLRLDAMVDGRSASLDTVTDFDRRDIPWSSASNELYEIGLFAFYKDANGDIKNVDYAGSRASGTGEILVDGGTVARAGVSMSDYYVQLDDGSLIPFEKGVIVYKASEDKNGRISYTASSAGSISSSSQIWMYDTKGDSDIDENATVIIWMP